MMTLVVRLCALCAMSALVEMALGESRFKGALRTVFGMLMIRTVLVRLAILGETLNGQTNLQDFFRCLIM